ncbi:MAG: thiamine diphosphokinase [Rhodobacteraceae bacterium]|nr:thiamine diphosphokinase [Paracoccaceae bacterium]
MDPGLPLPFVATIPITRRMAGILVRASDGVTIVGGGNVTRTAVNEALTLAPRLVAADGGADRALGLGLCPEAVIGDMDSITPKARGAIPADRLHRIPNQDTTDFEKCMGAIAAPLMLAVGFSGPRADHALAVCNALVRYADRRCIVIGGRDIVFAAPPRLDLPVRAGTRVSLFPLAPVRGESRGLAWPIGGLEFAPQGRIGTSNLATGPVTLEMSGPGMLVILPRRALRLAAAALAPGLPGDPPAPEAVRGG